MYSLILTLGMPLHQRCNFYWNFYWQALGPSGGWKFHAVSKSSSLITSNLMLILCPEAANIGTSIFNSDNSCRRICFVWILFTLVIQDPDICIKWVWLSVPMVSKVYAGIMCCCGLIQKSVSFTSSVWKSMVVIKLSRILRKRLRNRRTVSEKSGNC